MNATRTERLSRRKKILFLLAVIVISMGVLEAVARLHDRIRPDRLEAYKRFSANPDLGYELIPNYVALTPNGKRQAIAINSLGYRGPEFEPKKPAGVTRILCLGDSCTFEGIPENAPYPRLLEALLNEGEAQKRYEVINGAVEGYDSNKALERLREALEYQPDIVTIYIGWNDLYNVDPEHESPGRIARLASPLLSHSRFAAKLRSLIFLKMRPKLKTREPVKAEFYKKYRPARYEANLRRIIELIRERKALPLLVTLPSILSPRISDEGIERAQFPYYTNSITDMISLADSYNAVIRSVAAETHTPLVDLASEFDNMVDKERCFSDTIHMYNDAKPIVARALRSAIAGL
jgi:lysophospholipase L1-like esterase